MKLTREQIDRFHETGYLMMPNLFSTAEAQVLRQAADEVYALDRKEVVREKDGVAPRTAFAAHLYHEAFRRLGRHPRLIGPIMQLVDGPVYMHQYKVNAKVAFDGDVWQWHQDYGTWSRDDLMPEPRAMNIALFVDEATEFNGPLWIIPGSHRDGVFEAGHDPGDDQLSAVDAGQGHGYRTGGARRHLFRQGRGRRRPDVPRQSRARLLA